MPSFSPWAVTVTLSRGITATCENSEPAGFQHLVQPQTWLCAVWPFSDTVTFASEHLHCSVPPLKFAAAGLMPLSTAGWMEGALAMVDISSVWIVRRVDGCCSPPGRCGIEHAYWCSRQQREAYSCRTRRRAPSVIDHRADRLAFVHQVEAVVDPRQWQYV